ncbi:MAG: hypothetical protein LBU32_09940 [Clostridiales bacterium]|nr:hypothetical protein [Clostridiales bacterium]
MAHAKEEMQADGKAALRNKAARFAESIGLDMPDSLPESLAAMPAAAAARGFHGKMAGLAFEGAHCRTAYSRNMHGFSDALKSFALEALKKKRMEAGGPACIIIGDAASALSEGRSKSGASIEGAGRHFSHPGGAAACGRRIAAVSVGCGDLLSACGFFNSGDSGGLSAAEKARMDAAAGAAEARIKDAESREDKLKAAWKADCAAAASLDLEVAAIQKKVEFRYEALSKTGSAPEAGEGDQGAALKRRRAEDDLQNAGVELKGAKEGRKAAKAAAAESKRASGSARKSLAAFGREAKEAENSFIKAEAAAKVGFIESAAEKTPAVEDAAFVPAGSWRASKRTVDALSKINCVYIGNMKANRKIDSGSSGAKGRKIMAGVSDLQNPSSLRTLARYQPAAKHAYAVDMKAA